MASEYRVYNRQAPMHIRRPSGYSYFTEQARQLGLMGTELGRTHLEHFQDYDHQQHLHLYPHHRPFPPPHPHNVEAIQIELEKERIRGEIIMSEIVKRRILDDELRRQQMMEMELALSQGRNGFSFPTVALGFNSPVRLPLMAARAEERPLGERTERERLSGRHEIGATEGLTVWRGTDNLRIEEVNHVAWWAKEKDKFVLRGKPNDNVSGSKRKSEVLPLNGNASRSRDILAKKTRTRDL